jgi:hypothetical protein
MEDDLARNWGRERSENHAKKVTRMQLKHDYMNQMQQDRNNWGQSHMAYIGCGPTTIEAIGDNYEQLRNKLR